MAVWLGFGMEGQEFKMVIHMKKLESKKWLNAILFDIVKGLTVCKKRDQPQKLYL